MNSKSIYLADLTHTGIVLSSNVFPLSIGLIAAYIKEHRNDITKCELFKYPEDFSQALEKRPPDIVGFANYSWNFAISCAYAKQIKLRWPETIIVFGGPNYGLAADEIKIFWEKYGNFIDFYVVKEGEEAFLKLFDTLCEFNFDIGKIKKNEINLGNVHYLGKKGIIIGESLPRIKLEDLPSPYLKGLMDKFFDGNLCPLIHTTRGCPFKCAFCTEGAEYYNKVYQRLDNLEEELRYIAKKVKGQKDLFISDANFGMFKQDKDKAEILAKCQEDYGYPKYIHVSTGKNQKERVLEVVQSLNGAVSMAASLQSTDTNVLENVGRSNISIEKLVDAGKKATTQNTGTYSELILGLPGDTFEKHKQSLRDTINMQFDNIRMYQLILLPQTQLNSPENRIKYGMQTRLRIIPRSFGEYKLCNEKFIAVEREEILISSNTLTHKDYVKARELDLTVEMLHNGGGHAEVRGVCNVYGLSWFDDIIIPFFENRRNFSPEISQIFDKFVEGTSDRLWNNEEDLEKDVAQNISEMLLDDRGTNEMSTGKATAFFQQFSQINSTVFLLLKNALEKRRLLNTTLVKYLDELERYSRLRKINFLEFDKNIVDSFSIDLECLEKHKYVITPDQIKLSKSKRFELLHSNKQQSLIKQYSKEFGFNFDGLGKMLMRYPHIHNLFRKSQAIA